MCHLRRWGSFVSYGLVYFRISENKKRKLAGELRDLEKKLANAKQENKDLGRVFDRAYGINTSVYVFIIHIFKGAPP